MFAQIVVICLVLSVASAFTLANHKANMKTSLMMKNEFAKVASAGMLGASLFLGGLNAKAEIDYDGIKYLGGQEKVDINNANVRVYAKIPGMYPTIAGKITSTKTPFKNLADVYNIPGLTSAEKDVIKKNENRLIALEAKPEYFIDRINNGLYR